MLHDSVESLPHGYSSTLEECEMVLTNIEMRKVCCFGARKVVSTNVHDLDLDLNGTDCSERREDCPCP